MDDLKKMSRFEIVDAVDACIELLSRLSRLEALEKKMESAPHGTYCTGFDISDGPCDCWKSKEPK